MLWRAGSVYVSIRGQFEYFFRSKQDADKNIINGRDCFFGISKILLIPLLGILVYPLANYFNLLKLFIMHQHNIGVLAYGSLIDDPGSEFSAKISVIIDCITPFEVEFARSSKGRSNAPTLIPVKEGGAKVNAKILVLQNVTMDEAKNMLWRRETRATDLSKEYHDKKDPGINDVVVKLLKDFEGVENVLYTSIGQNIPTVNGSTLAKLAIDSYFDEAGDTKTDGIHYLLNAKNNGIKTALSDEYEKSILKATKTINLQEAIDKLSAQKTEYTLFKNEKDDFEKEYRVIGDLIHNYGLSKTVEQTGVDPKETKEIVEKHWKLFKTNVHEGFKQGQLKILGLLIKFEKERNQLEGYRKTLRGVAAKEGKLKAYAKIKIIEDREHLLRHLIDSIVWQLIQGQLYISRRLYQGVEGKSNLLNTNIQSVAAVAEDLNKEPENFALITDLSSYVQTGDILLMSKSGLRVIEVKEGEKNKRSFEIIESLMNAETTLEELVKDPAFDRHAAEQLQRNLKQKENAQRILEIINTDKGKDKAGNSVKIITPKEDTPIFYKEIHQLEEQLKERKFWAYDVIDECLHVGIYKGPMRFAGHKILEGIAKEKGCNYVMADYRRVTRSLNRPIFALPFSPELVYDILFRKVTMIFMLDIDTFLNFFGEFGMTARWMTRRETAKIKDEYKLKELFLKDNQAIEVTGGNKGHSLYVQYGMFHRMFFELIYPSYAVYACHYSLFSNEDENGGDGENSNAVS